MSATIAPVRSLSLTGVIQHVLLTSAAGRAVLPAEVARLFGLSVPFARTLLDELVVQGELQRGDAGYFVRRAA